MIENLLDQTSQFCVALGGELFWEFFLQNQSVLCLDVLQKKICDEILLIWSTKWSLFTKLFAQMGCKSRDESNDAN